MPWAAGMDLTSMLSPLRWKMPVSWATHPGWSLAEPGASEIVTFVSDALGDADGWTLAVVLGVGAVGAPVAGAGAGATVGVHAATNAISVAMHNNNRWRRIRRVPLSAECRSRRRASETTGGCHSRTPRGPSSALRRSARGRSPGDPRPMACVFHLRL